MNKPPFSDWRRSLIEAACFTILILGLFYYWFAIANRYVIFLYGHTAGGIQSSGAQPFDDVTASRYWMAGLVASAIALVLYVPLCWLQGQIARWRQKPVIVPAWWQTWLLTAIPITLGIPLITMTANWPTLSPVLAAACVAATLLGLAVVILAGNWATHRPKDLLWLLADGVGVMSVLLLLRVVELPGRGLSVSPTIVWIFAVGGLLGGAVWLFTVGLLRRWRRVEMPSAIALFTAGAGLSYLILPLVHFVFFAPPEYHYISTASNFFAFNWGLQIFTFIVAFGLAVAATSFRGWLNARSLQPMQAA